MQHVRIKQAAEPGPGELAAGHARDAWLRALADFDPTRAETIKHDARSGVHRARMHGRDVIVKVASLASLADGLKHALRASQAWRQWRGAERLRRAGVDVAACLTLASARTADGRPVEVLLLEAIAGEHVLQHLAGVLTIERERAIAAGIGLGLAHMLDQGLANRDHKLSNLIVAADAGDPGGCRVVIVDSVAIRRIGAASRPAALTRMLADMLVEALGCGVPVRLALRRRLVREYLRAVWHAHEGDSGNRVEFEEWELGSARAIWRRVDEAIRGRPIGPPRVSPLR
ncbi:MAG: hypothetical protein AB7K52_10435 [Phycisphaerales bacterium]